MREAALTVMRRGGFPALFRRPRPPSQPYSTKRGSSYQMPVFFLHPSYLRPPGSDAAAAARPRAPRNSHDLVLRHVVWRVTPPCDNDPTELSMRPLVVQRYHVVANRKLPGD